MAATPLKQASSTKLKDLLEALAASIGEAITSLIGLEIELQGEELVMHDAKSLADSLPRTSVLARSTLGSDDKTVNMLIELPDAVAMAGLLMMTPEDTINERRQEDAFIDEDAAAFGELGTVIATSVANVLTDKGLGAEVSFDRHVTLAPGGQSDLLANGQQVAFGFRMKMGEYPESNGSVVVDMQTAEQWNGSPLETEAGDASVAADEGKPTTSRFEDDGLDSIPEAPIRGVLSAFAISGEVFKLMRKSCRRVGLELKRHGKNEIPNPAAHRNQIVMLDIVPGEDRRFDWCRRIKEMSDTTKVVLLIHHPSRQRVTQAFLSRADAIVGFPCDESQLSQKLGQLLADLPSPDPASDDG